MFMERDAEKNDFLRKLKMIKDIIDSKEVNFQVDEIKKGVVKCPPNCQQQCYKQFQPHTENLYEGFKCPLNIMNPEIKKIILNRYYFIGVTIGWFLDNFFIELYDFYWNHPVPAVGLNLPGCLYSRVARL